MSNLLVNGRDHDVPGVEILGPGEAPWALLPAGDTRPRTTAWVRQYILHKTIGDVREVIMDGAGPRGADQATIQGWRDAFRQVSGPGKYRGAHLVTGHDGRVVQLADLFSVETFHATVSNAWSVGHETCESHQRPGGVYSAALGATVETCLAACEALGIQWQMPRLLSYGGYPIRRMVNGGPDMIGIFGHRNNSGDRGCWDPGEVLFQMLAARGVMQFDFDKREDIAFWMTVQQDLAARKFYSGPVDGVPGPVTTLALKAAGYRSGIYALGK